MTIQLFQLKPLHFSLPAWLFLGVITLLLIPAIVNAEVTVKLDSKRDKVDVIHKNTVVKVQRQQDTEHRITGNYSKTSRKCPPFCIQPVEAVTGVKTIGEYEIFDFMENELISGDGLIIDTRTPDWFNKGTIPGSINIPFNILEIGEDNAEKMKTLDLLGVRKRTNVSSLNRILEKWGFLNGNLKNDTWDFTQAKKIIIWCDGIWSGQSSQAVRALTKLGYPKDRIFYYRGGMQAWQILGLTTIKP